MADMMPILGGKHVQAKIRPNEYTWLKQAAKEQGLTLQQAVREAIREWAFANLKEDPRMKFIGMIHGPPDIADNIDEIYLED